MKYSVRLFGSAFVVLASIDHRGPRSFLTSVSSIHVSKKLYVEACGV